MVQSQGGSFNPESIYQSASPGVVTILSIFPGGSLSSILGGGGGSAAEGSGFVINDSGEIATNAHVVTDADSPGSGPIHEAKEVYVQFGDRNRVRATIVGFDPNADVALLKVDPNGLDLKPLTLATNEKVTVGQPVAAIGSPFDQESSLSVGVVSATDRSIQSLDQIPDRRGDPDRRRDQPGQLRRPAARLGRARDRDQPADQHQLGRQRGRRLRGADRARGAFARRSCAKTARSSTRTSASRPSRSIHSSPTGSACQPTTARSSRR